MAIEQKHPNQTIVIEPDTDLTEILDKAMDAPLGLERDGVLFRLEREPSPIGDLINPEEYRAALRETAGLFAGIDKDAYHRDLRFWRGEVDDESE